MKNIMKTAGLKQFIDSKTQLLEALQRDPIHRATYEVTKYCKVPVGESKESKQYIPLKPKQRIIIEWKYNNDDLESIPHPLSIEFEFMNENSIHQTFQSGEKLRKWIYTNAHEVTKL